MWPPPPRCGPKGCRSHCVACVDGGAISSATGGDFKTGAMAAGASQAMAGVLNSTFDTQPQLRQAFSQIVGLTAAGLAGGDVNKASWVALMADEYNRQLHQKKSWPWKSCKKRIPKKRTN